jgi:PEP-CTERM motif
MSRTTTEQGPISCGKWLTNGARILGILLVWMLGGVELKATPVTLVLDPAFPANYLYYAYTDTNGQAQSTYAGPYKATLQGGGYDGSQTYYVYCYDFHVDTNVGTTYAGSMLIPTTESEIEAAYLQDRAFSQGGFNGVLSVIGPYSMAIWQIMNPSSINPAAFAYDAAAQALVAEATQAYTNGTWTQADAQKYAIWVPDNMSASQRFGAVAPVPEPGSMLLVGAGLALASVLRRRGQQSR